MLRIPVKIEQRASGDSRPYLLQEQESRIHLKSKPILPESSTETPVAGDETGLENERLRNALVETERALEEARRQLEIRDEEIDNSRFEISSLRTRLLQKEQYLNRITRTLGWRLLSNYGPLKYAIVIPAIKSAKRFLRPRAKSGVDPKSEYKRWTRLCEEYRYKPEAAERTLNSFHYRPTISIVMPAYNSPPQYLEKAIQSVLSQYYPDWELCICDDASPEPHVREILERYAAGDRRIKVHYLEKNRGISAASNHAMAMATGEFVGFLDHDDELTVDALLEVASVLQHVEADLIYSDEDKLDTGGNRCDAFAKPAWSPDLLLSTMYTCHFSVYRKEIVDRIGGLRESFDGSQDYDLALRFTEKTERIAHIPKILYHWRKIEGSAASSYQAKPYAYDAAGKALNEALRRRKLQAEVVPMPTFGFFRIKRRLVKPGKVSIIIPTRDKVDLLRRCINSIEERTDYSDFEIVIVDNGSKQQETLNYLKGCGHQVIRDDSPFNFSGLNNLGASRSSGEYLLMLNNDTEVIATEWLSALLEQAQRPEVGAVGAKLLYPDGSIQHAGVILGIGGVAAHSHLNQTVGEEGGYFNFPNIIRDYSAITGACLMTRRELFDQMGGLNDSDLAESFNDVDYCLRLRKKGYLVVYTPFSILYHHESASRSKVVNDLENTYMLDKWAGEISRDPYYSPSLTLEREDYSLDYYKPEGFVRVYTQDLSEETVGRLVTGRTIGQYFYPGSEPISGIAIRFGLYSRKSAGRLRFHLRESHKSDEDIAAAEIPASGLRDNEYFLFTLDKVTAPGNKLLYFFVELAEGSADTGPAIWRSSIDNSVVGPYYLNHRPRRGTLSFSVYSEIRYRYSEPTERN
jgi:GT2 family glycosyltransferase